ncbi:hypothetical protein LO762_09685 [Actinocorallia sp. API 0066]|uniref:hypothetical protein n=1 Tax=Actinocorallia sp. API 0066 TaxID=2896846 RepID=UPI001E423563|nr:hypothetical protein [Actinocorallia sp. API 0066]MCD0449459.1 hypothetical protein [Actinocorallia sp. API 0066]
MSLGAPTPTAVAPPADHGTTPIDAAADESAAMATWMASTNVDDRLVEELSRQVRAISAAYLWSPPLPLLNRTRRLRGQVAKLLQGRQSPAHSRDLYLINARLSSILAWMAGDLGAYGAAGEHASAAWMAANLAEHPGALTWVRATQSKLAYWSGAFADSADLAADGLTYPGTDGGVLLLHLLEARAYARMGAVNAADGALRAWRSARERGTGADEVGGVLGLSMAQQHYLAGSVLLELRQPGDALGETRTALGLFETAPPMERFLGAEACARLDAVRACLDTRNLDGVEAELAPILAIEPDQRLDTLSTGLRLVQRDLAAPHYRDTPVARDLQGAISSFMADTASRQLELRS